jgi:tetratricopeptide (TPR) repeat protein
VARAQCEESLALCRAIGDNFGIANALGMLGAVALAQGDTAVARARCEECLALHRASGDKAGVAWALSWLGAVALEEGNTRAAQALYDEGLVLRRAMGHRWAIADYMLSLGLVARAEGQIDQAEALFAEGLAQYHTLGAKYKVAWGLAGLVAAAADRAVSGQAVSFAQRAARLAGATAAILETVQVPLDRQFRIPYARATTTARAILGDEAFDAAWAAGKQLSLDDAVAFALTLDASRS